MYKCIIEVCERGNVPLVLEYYIQYDNNEEYYYINNYDYKKYIARK